MSVPQCKTLSFFSFFLLEHPSSSSASSCPTCAELFFLDFLAAAFVAACFCNLHGAKPSVKISESSPPPPPLSLSLCLCPLNAWRFEQRFVCEIHLHQQQHLNSMLIPEMDLMI